MPSEKKRINLTFSDEIYQKLQKYKDANGLFQDAPACMQLIVKQLRKEGYDV